MTRDIQKEMLQKETIRRLQREKKLLAAQKEALILFSLGLLTILGFILISI